MHQTKDQLYQSMNDVYSVKKFTTILKQRSKEYDGLFDDQTLALLLLDELGRNKQVISNIAEIQPDTDCTVVGTVIEIHAQKNFKKKNGTTGKLVRLSIGDDTGSCGLILWNDDTHHAHNLKKGTQIKVVNGYVKQGFTGGVEINLGRWSLLEIEPTEGNSNPQIHDQRQDTDITGVLTHKEPTRAFFMDSGEFGFVTTITLKEHNKEHQFTLWGEKVKEIQNFKIGEQMRITNPQKKQRNGKFELHINGKSMIQRC